MPPEADARGSPQEWLRHAKSNLARAKQPKPEEALWEHFCFDAQQAAEKAVKAVLVFCSIDFPKTHMVAKLLALLDDAGQAIPDELWAAATVLTPYAIEARYPGMMNPVTEEEYCEAVALAEKVVRWAEKLLLTGQE